MEDWKFVKYGDDPAYCYILTDNGRDLATDTDEQMKRAVACVNALQGIPTDQIGEVRKAWLACYAIQQGLVPLGHCHNEFFQTGKHSFADFVINELLQMRKIGADFGELNALIDSAKE